MLKYKYTVMFSVIFVVSMVIVLKYGRIYSGPEVFLPGYKPGVPPSEIEDPTIKALVKVERLFGDHLNLTILLKNPNTFFEATSLRKLKELEEKLRNIDGVENVLSVVDVPRFEGFSVKNYVEDGKLVKDVLKDPNTSTFITKDGRYALIYCALSAKRPSREVVAQIRKILKDYEELSPMMLGEPIIDQELFSELTRQTSVYPPLIFSFILIVFLFQTRSLKGSLLSLIIPVMASITIMAIHFSLGNFLNILTAMTISYLMIIGSAYGLHFYNGVQFYENVEIAAKRKFIPIMFSMLTTVAGFTSFIFLDIRAFKELGILVSSGLALVFVMVFTFMRETVSVSSKKPRSLGVVYLGGKFAKAILFFMIVITLVSPFILRNIEIGTTGLNYFRKSSEIRKAYGILSKEFHFREPVYLVLEKEKPFTALDNKKLAEIMKNIEKIEGVSKVSFPVDIPIPLMRILVKNQPFLRFFIKGKALRMIINLTPEGVAKAEEIKEDISKILAKYEYNYTIAGTIFVWVKINSEILSSQIKSLFIALLLIFAIVLAIFRRLIISLTTMIPIGFTALMNFINMTVLHINLEISTSIITSMLMGLVIDYSIHIASEIKRTKSAKAAVENVGPAILGNALGLIAGFSILLLSPLALFSNVAILMILGISIGVFVTLTVETWILEKFI